MQLDFDSMRQLVRTSIPHVRELGIDLAAIEPGKMTLKLDYQARLIGNPETGVLHGGVITVLLDTAGGLAVYTLLDAFVPVATLDLRIDYLKPASVGRTLFAQAHCYKLTRHIAFCRGVAYHDSVDEPIAHAAGSFMLSAASAPMATQGN